MLKFLASLIPFDSDRSHCYLPPCLSSFFDYSLFIIQYSFSLLLLVLAFAGCTAPRRVTGGEVDHDPVLRMLEASYASTQDLTVEGNLKISGVPVTVWFDAFVRSRDSMKIVLTGPFGMSVGAMSATPEYFLFFNPELGEAVEGRPDRQTFQQLILIGLDYNEMISLLRGEIPRVPAAGEYTAAVEEDGIRYIVERAGQREEFLVDP